MVHEDTRAMSSPSGGLVCPRCGTPMNFHAEKVDAAGAESSRDGLVVEFHTCPACKYVLERSSPA